MTLISDYKSALTKLCLGNKASTHAQMAQIGNLCKYFRQQGHWKSNCPKLCCDFGLPQPTSTPSNAGYVNAVGGPSHQIKILTQSTSAVTLDDPSQIVCTTSHSMGSKGGVRRFLLDFAGATDL
ncbi:hypothetical protein PPACK8108_LOCUS10463 [Phakopsora pachyrhizi]|uniref:Uncharacterized protein n=1 Tax=Phakopsora pachyrhizi TaxID=170000 RepID=A0AAV0AYX0_PHAPC|nr:hypothetical protein PPACK8108_LOCUS10463 [Phakopsora pachyrhizi]